MRASVSEVSKVLSLGVPLSLIIQGEPGIIYNTGSVILYVNTENLYNSAKDKILDFDLRSQPPGPYSRGVHSPESNEANG